MQKVGYNEYGYPACPNDSSLAMKYHGVIKEDGRSVRIKCGCPKMHFHHGWNCQCMAPAVLLLKAEPLIPTIVSPEGRLETHTSTKSDVFLAGIASQLTVIVAAAMNCPRYIRSLKPLVA